MASLTKEPETFQHYQVMRRDDGSLWELGRGAMGVTYKAFDTNLRAPVALKVINALHLDSETSRARFVREARAAAGLRHRNVASVYHLGHDDQSFFYAMEFVDGDTVEGLVKRQGVLSPAVALQITLQVSRALGAAAKQQLVHRDIKPANLMVVTEDEEEDQLIVKVIDFGLARPALTGEGSAHITMGGFVGTPQYASPEQLEEKELDARSDIYSLGITLWYMLAGKPPFSGALGSVFIQQLTKPPPWEHLVGTPEPVRALLAHLLEKDPDKRPQSPVELRREVEICLRKLPSETGRITVPGHGSASTGTATPTTSTLADTNVSSGGTADATATQVEDAGTNAAGDILSTVPATGTVLAGHYVLDYQVGEGNNGRVFRARDLERSHSVFAVKLLHPDVLKESSQVDRLEVALEKLRRAPHPNLLSFDGLHHSGGVKFLVGEWVNGFNLVEVLRARGKLAVREVLPLLGQAAAAADHARSFELPPLELGLHQILAHFPEVPLEEKGGSTVTRATLNLSVDKWPRYLLKFDAIGALREAGDSVTLTGDMTMLPNRPLRDRDTQTSIRGLVEGSHIFSLATLVYELLNGSPPAQNRPDEGRDGKYAALPALNEAGNNVLRKALSPNPGFATSTAFFRDLLAASGLGDQPVPANLPVSPRIVEPEVELEAATLSDSSETMFFDPRAESTPAVVEPDDSSAATLVEGLVVTAREVQTTVPTRTVPPVEDTPPATESVEEEETSEAPTLQGYSFVSRGEGTVVVPPDGSIDPRAPIVEKDDYGSEDIEAPTLDGYAFNAPGAETPDAMIPPVAVDRPIEVGRPLEDASGDIEAPTLQGYSFKTAPAEVIVPVVLREAAPATPAVAAPAGVEVPPEAEAATLAGYSFKAHTAEIILPPTEQRVAHEEDKPVEDDNVVLPAVARVVEPVAVPPEVVDVPPLLPEPTPLAEEFLVVADAPVPEIAPPSPEEPSQAVAAPVAKPSPVLEDHAAISLDVAEMDSPVVAPVQRVLPKEVSPPAKTPVPVVRFVDKPLPDKLPAARAKRPNFALMGIAAAVVVIGVSGTMFALRGGKAQPSAPVAVITTPVTPAPTPNVVPLEPKAATPNPKTVEVAARQELAARNLVATPAPVFIQSTPAATPALAIEPVSTPSMPPMVTVQETADSLVQGITGVMPPVIEVATPSPQRTPRDVNEPASTGVGAVVAEVKRPRSTPTTASEAVARASDKADAGDEEDSGDREQERRAAREAKRRESAPTPKPAAREREREPKVSEPPPERERVVVKREPRPEPTPKAVVKREPVKPAPTPDVDRPRGPAVPFMH